MPTPVIANHVKLDTQFIQRVENTENVFYVDLGVPVTGSNISSLATVVEAWWNDTMKGNMPSTTALANIHITDLTTALSPVYDFPLSTPVPGTGAQGLPNSITFSIQKSIAERYKGGHGRVYVCGIPGDAINGNEMDEGPADDLVAGFNNLLTTIGETFPDGNSIVVLRTTGDGATPLHPRSIPVNVFRYADLHLDSQRDRLAGRGS